METGDGSLGQPAYFLVNFQCGGVLGFIIDKEQFPASQLHDLLYLPLVILYPSQGNKNRIAGIDPPQILAGTDDLVGDLILCQKGRPGGLDKNSGGDHKDIIGILRQKQQEQQSRRTQDMER